MMKDLYLIGGGGHCRSCIDAIEGLEKYRIVGLVDLPEKKDQEVLGYKVVASDKDLPVLVRDGGSFLITLGQIGSPQARISLFEQLVSLGALCPEIVSPQSYVSKYSKIGAGTIVMHRATVNAVAEIGVNCILNSHCLVEHDATIGDHCHISTGAIVNGACRVGKGTFVGSNSVLAHGVSVADRVVIGAGSVVCKDIYEEGVYVGNPCRKIR